MQVGLLGPLEVTGPQGRVQISGAKERLVLALLVLRAGQVVSRDALIDAVWGDDPPATAVKTLQGHIARVRRALEAVGLADAITTRAPGYVLDVPADAIDAIAFERHATAGRRALVEGDAERATAALGTALGLWRGDALADCRTGGWTETEAVRLDELRVATVEDRIDADLMLGHHGALVGELEALVARYPLRERLWGALMLALYRAGRQGDALRAYQRARATLVGEIGLEPGAELRRLEAAVLAGDPSPSPAGDEVAIPLPRRIGAASAAVFVGRTAERERLRASLDAATSGERRIVLVSGEPGIGKTSLSASFARDAGEIGAVVLYGRCDEDLGIPYQPWAELLTHLVAHAPDDVLAAHARARGQEVARLAPNLTRRAPEGDVSTSDAESERYLLFGAVVDVLARVSARVPVVLVLDDLHWADPPTIQLLRHVASSDAPLRLLVVGTYRESDVGNEHPLTEALAALHREPGVERLALRGLGKDELLTLVETTADHAIAKDGVALRDALLAETDGNPFFVGEFIRHLAETRTVYLQTSGLPVSIREVIGRRIARLGAQTQGALSLAAVIGREFDVALLARVAQIDEDTLIDLCDEAVAAAVLSETDGMSRYAFAHALIEHALYDELSAPRRGRTHHLCAEALEALSGASAGELAYHWARAEPPDPEKAIACAQRAGDQALADLAPEEALRWYGNALDRLDHCANDDPRRRAELLVGFGDAQRQTGDARHRETLLVAARVADDLDAVGLLVRAVLRNNRGFNNIAGRVDRERVEMINRALTRLPATDSPDRARLLALLCVEGLFEMDFDERLSLATQAIDTARRTGDNAALVDAIRLCQESIAMPQTLELRCAWNTEACDLADDLGDPTARLHANDYRLLSALEAGDLATMQAARAIFESESERIGQPLNWWQIAYHRAWQRVLEGDLDAAEEFATAALTVGTAAGSPADAGLFYGSQLIDLRWKQGRMYEMIPFIEQTVPPPGLTIWRAITASAKSYDEPHNEVRGLLDAEVASDFPMHADATWLVAHTIWAEVAARTAHRAAATVLYQRLLPWHNQFSHADVTLSGSVAHYLGLLAHALDRHDDADHWFAQALALHERMQAPFFIAFTQTAWAALCVDRNTGGDAPRARMLLDAALAAATTNGYGAVERDARAVRARMLPGPSVADDSG